MDEAACSAWLQVVDGLTLIPGFIQGLPLSKVALPWRLRNRGGRCLPPSLAWIRRRGFAPGSSAMLRRAAMAGRRLVPLSLCCELSLWRWVLRSSPDARCVCEPWPQWLTARRVCQDAWVVPYVR